MNKNFNILYNKASQIAKILLCHNYFISIDHSPSDDNSINLTIDNNIAILYYLPKLEIFTLSFYNDSYYNLITPNMLPDDIFIIPLKSKLTKNLQNKINIDNNITPNINNKIADIFVDGSFMNNTIASAYVILLNDKIIFEHSFIVDDKSLLPYRNIAGEIKAVEEAIKKATELNFYGINIHFDYSGLKEWATGNWKRNNELTQNYYNFIQKTKLKINWIKIQAHSANKMNDYTDKLAKNCIVNSLS